MVVGGKGGGREEFAAFGQIVEGILARGEIKNVTRVIKPDIVNLGRIIVRPSLTNTARTASDLRII